MRILLFLTLLTGGRACTVLAQDGFVSQSGAPLSWNVFDHNGKTFVNPAPEIEGNPFLTDSWRLGSLIVNTNRRFDSIKIRLNILSQEVHILDAKNTEIALNKGYIKEILWQQKPTDVSKVPRFQCGFPAVDEQDAGNFYEVVCEGSVWLLHSIRKVISQRKNDVSGEIKRGYDTYEDYYVYDGSKMIRVKRDKTFLSALSPDKKDKVEAFAAANKLRYKTIDDLKKLIDYYNTL